MRKAFADTIGRNKPENLFFLTGDVGFGVLENLEISLGKRFINVGVAEQNMVGMAAGISSSGFKSITYSIGNFATLRCLEQIRLDVCYHKLPVMITAVGSGFSYGAQGYSHHLIEDIASMSSLPNINILLPSDPNEVEYLVDLFLNSDMGPTYLRLAKGGETNLSNSPIDLEGKFRLVKNKSSRSAVFSHGAISKEVLEVVELLEGEGQSIDFLTTPILPTVEEVLEKVQEKGYEKIFVVEEHIAIGGLGTIFCHALANQKNIELITKGVNHKQIPTRFGDRQWYLEKVGLSAEAINGQMRDFFAITK